MASRNKPVTLRVGKLSRKCAATKRYAVGQLIDNRFKTGSPTELIVQFRTDSVRATQDHVRRLAGWHFVFDLSDGRMIWEGNTSSHWELESFLRNYHADRER